MTVSRAMVTVAHCDFCPNTLPHVSSETSPWAFFIRHRWTVVELPASDASSTTPVFLVACSDRSCKRELDGVLASRASSLEAGPQ